MQGKEYSHSYDVLPILFAFYLAMTFPNALLAAAKLEDILRMDVVVHIIDVGVGDAILIELPDAENEVLIDGGDRLQGYNVLDYLGIYVDDPIELGIVTHPNYAHWSGIERVLDSGYTISELWDPGYGRDCRFSGDDVTVKKKKGAYLKFIDGLPREGMKIFRRPVPVNPKVPLKEIDGVSFTVLHSNPNPPGKECSYIVGNASIVVRMQYKEVVFLFTGDINGKETDELGNAPPSHVEAKLLELNKLSPGILQADVLKVPSHGSESASTRAFIKAVQPRVALISSASTSTYQLPEKRVLQRYRRIHFGDGKKIEKILYTNYGETSFAEREFGDDHIICGTNGEKSDLVCDYMWNFEEIK